VVSTSMPPEVTGTGFILKGFTWGVGVEVVDDEGAFNMKGLLGVVPEVPEGLI